MEFVDKIMSLLFNMLLGFHSISPKEQVFFNFMAAVTICSGFGAQQKTVCHCFHCFPVCREVMGQEAMILVFDC